MRAHPPPLYGINAPVGQQSCPRASNHHRRAAARPGRLGPVGMRDGTRPGTRPLPHADRRGEPRVGAPAGRQCRTEGRAGPGARGAGDDRAVPAPGDRRPEVPSRAPRSRATHGTAPPAPRTGAARRSARPAPLRSAPAEAGRPARRRALGAALRDRRVRARQEVRGLAQGQPGVGHLPPDVRGLRRGAGARIRGWAADAADPSPHRPACPRLPAALRPPACRRRPARSPRRGWSPVC